MLDQVYNFFSVPSFAALPVVAAMVALRLGGLVLAMPGLCVGIPVRMRLALIVVMTVVLAPSVMRSADASVFESVTSAEEIGLPQITKWSVGGVREVILGMVIGGIAQFLISGMQLAGELVSSSTGMQLATTADPSTGASVPQFSRLIGLLVTCLFFAIGGHRILVSALLDSFGQVPPLSMATQSVADQAGMLSLLIDPLTMGCESGIRIAAPCLACILLSNVIVALISRAIPGLNVIAVGINLNVLAALVVLGLTIGSVGLIFETEFAETLGQFKATLRQ
ncbi:flagellar biosynthetic protein FliR [Rhodopirellula sp. MGV]|uniref:flagellar biosynthetic protein FliR n=1 Tax=Rhodopirellula sp. MGV TaxID=2023130 RepID=UPI000B975696|nr:flagellar biosynthetic protein FliR [Rhodopirellula sp. MGV]OYP30361.1 hypothetical protein CGZ80_23050 [Rhodopirellula sp. MGV]PNY34716.1 type III secretion protein [Rhodopirellula baltica]